MQACSLKFCTAIERPAPIRLCAAVLQQRVHRHHQVAADRAEQDQERRRDPDVGDDVQADHQHAHGDAVAGSRCVAWSSRMRSEATIAPAAVPIATTPTSDEACVVV